MYIDHPETQIMFIKVLLMNLLLYCHSYTDKRNSEIILAGYYNKDLLQINRKRIVGEFFYLLTSHSFYPQITRPTRLSTMRGTLIDIIFCKLSTTTCQSSASILASGMSDHFPCFISLSNVKPSITRNTISQQTNLPQL